MSNAKQRPGRISAPSHIDRSGHAEKIEAKAVQLLASVTHGRQEPGSRKKDNSPSVLRGAAVMLLRECNRHAVPPPGVLVDLIASLMSAVEPAPDRPTLTEQRWRALHIESRSVANQEFDQNRGIEWKFHEPAQIVARAAGVTRQAVYQWRQDPEYARGMRYLVTQELMAKLEASERAILRVEDKSETQKQIDLVHLHAKIKQWWEVKIKEGWKGPIRSPFDLGENGREYSTFEEYFDHLVSMGVSSAERLDAEERPRDQAKEEFERRAGAEKEVKIAARHAEGAKTREIGARERQSALVTFWAYAEANNLKAWQTSHTSPRGREWRVANGFPADLK